MRDIIEVRADDYSASADAVIYEHVACADLAERSTVGLVGCFVIMDDGEVYR